MAIYNFAVFRKELRKPRPTFAVHYHHKMPGMNGTTDLIRPLRRYLDARGCDLKVGVVLRDSVDWAVSRSRYQTDFDGSHISQKAANTRDGQCRYLLYNTPKFQHLSLPVCDLARADDIFDTTSTSWVPRTASTTFGRACNRA